MIPADFAYYRPEGLDQLSAALSKTGGKPFSFYGGGSEVITMARAGTISPAAVIDLKGIPECRYLGRRAGKIVIGAGVPLAQIDESGLFPLLGKTGARIADHTNQCRITLGGNLCGTICYREAALPLMLCDAEVSLWHKGAVRSVSLEQVFKQKMNLSPGEAVIAFAVAENWAALPYVHVKRTRGSKIDYPLCTVAAVKTQQEIRLAFSGVYPYPFREKMLEKLAGDRSLSPERRADKIVKALDGPVLEDLIAGKAYRLFVLKEALRQTLERLEGAS